MKNRPTSINIDPADKAARAAGLSRSAWVVAAAIRLRIEGLTFDQIADRLNA